MFNQEYPLKFVMQDFGFKLLHSVLRVQTHISLYKNIFYNRLIFPFTFLEKEYYIFIYIRATIKHV